MQNRVGNAIGKKKRGKIKYENLDKKIKFISLKFQTKGLKKKSYYQNVFQPLLQYTGMSKKSPYSSIETVCFSLT